MTVIEKNAYVGDMRYTPNDVRKAILNNTPVEEKLHMIICVSNPCQYARRFDLAREFIQRMELYHQRDVILYVVELAYGKQRFLVTESNNPRHLQIRTDTAPIWAKESMLNVGTRLLPPEWRCVSFVDSDVEFDNPDFAVQTLKLLNGTYDIVHLHSHALDLNNHGDPMNAFSSFGYQYTHRRPYGKTGIHYFHPGYDIAMTREAYEQLGGLYDKGIVGSGDHHLMLCLIQNCGPSVHQQAHPGYHRSVREYQERCKGLRFSYVPGSLKHFFHGDKKNRKYLLRWDILTKHQYDPYKHVTYLENGLMVPSDSCPPEMLKDIYKYFAERDEDNGINQLIAIAKKEI